MMRTMSRAHSFRMSLSFLVSISQPTTGMSPRPQTEPQWNTLTAVDAADQRPYRTSTGHNFRSEDDSHVLPSEKRLYVLSHTLCRWKHGAPHFSSNDNQCLRWRHGSLTEKRVDSALPPTWTWTLSCSLSAPSAPSIFPISCSLLHQKHKHQEVTRPTNRKDDDIDGIYGFVLEPEFVSLWKPQVPAVDPYWPCVWHQHNFSQTNTTIKPFSCRLLSTIPDLCRQLNYYGRCQATSDATSVFFCV